MWPLTLDEVADGGRAQTGEQRSGALLSRDLAEAAQHAAVVLDRVQLDARLDDVDRRERTVRDGAADAAGERSLQEVAAKKDTWVRLLGPRRRRGGCHKAGGRSGCGEGPSGRAPRGGRGRVARRGHAYAMSNTFAPDAATKSFGIGSGVRAAICEAMPNLAAPPFWKPPKVGMNDMVGRPAARVKLMERSGAEEPTEPMSHSSSPKDFKRTQHSIDHYVIL